MVAVASIPDTMPILQPLRERADGKSGPWRIQEGGAGGNAVSFFVDTHRLEERTNGKGWVKELDDGRFRVKAKAQHCGVKNRNGRIYPPHVWDQHLKESAAFRQSLHTRRIIGHLEHPEDGKSQMPLGAIVVTEAFPPDENGEVFIIFETMLTPGGKVVEAYIRSRVGFGLSSRGNGSVITRNGIDEVQADFEPQTWDCVIQESTIGAEVEALRESWQDRPGTPEEFTRYLAEARKELSRYVDHLIEKSDGNAVLARELAEADNMRAAGGIDCEGGVCKCVISEDDSEDVPPSGYSRYLLAFEDGSAHYRGYQGSTGQWEVWMHPHNLPPERLASKIPTLSAAHQVAENHYNLILAGGAMSAQTHAANSNAIADDAGNQMMTPVAAPSPIGGMAGMMGRHSGPAGPGPATSVPPRPQQAMAQAGAMPKITLSFESVRAQWPDVLAKLQEQFSIQKTVPFSGSVCELELSNGDERKKAQEALDGSGFFVEELDATHLRVYTTFDDEEQACQHVERVLRGKGLKHNQMEAVGIVEDGQVFLEDNMGNLIEYAPDKSNPGGGMAGGDTVPDIDSGGDADGTSHYHGEDPEDLDLDLDVNENGIDYPYDVDEQKLQRGVLTPVSPKARQSAGMKPIKKRGLVPLTPSARKSMGMPEADDDDDYGDDWDDDREDETYRESDDMPYDDDDMYESDLEEANGGRAGQQAMFAKAFARTPKSKSTGKPTNPRNQADNARLAAKKGSKVGKNYRNFRSVYAAKHGLREKPIIGKGERKAKPSGPAQRRKKKRNESMERHHESDLDEAGGGRAGQQAMFAKAFGKGDRSRKARETWPKHRKFRAKYAKERGMNQGQARHLGDRRKKTGKKKNEGLSESVQVRHDAEGYPIGAVRIFENEHGPTSFEFYSTDGILESIFDGDGDPIYIPESPEFFDPNMIAEDERTPIEVWEDATTGELHYIYEDDLDEDELSGRDGGKTGVVIKGDAYMGDKGPEYSVGDLPSGGDRGQTGKAVKPPTHGQATENPGRESGATQDDGGKHIKKGNWPTSGDSASGVPGGKGKASSMDGDGGSAAKKMAERIEALEYELSLTQDQLSETDEELTAMRESAVQQELDYARASIMARHPELKLAEARFLRCESVEDIIDEANTMLSLMEQRQPTAPRAATTVQPLTERGPEPTLAALSGRSAVSSANLQGGPSGPLNESISSSDGLRKVEARREVGDTASRVADRRKRRLRERSQG